MTQTFRRLVTLPQGTANAVEAYQAAHGHRSLSDALRALIERGLATIETPEQLVERCAQASLAGKPLTSIMAEMADHPLVDNVTMNPDVLAVKLKGGGSFTFSRRNQGWGWEEMP